MEDHSHVESAASDEGLTDEQAQDVHDALSDALGVPREPLAASTLPPVVPCRRCGRIACACTQGPS